MIISRVRASLMAITLFSSLETMAEQNYKEIDLGQHKIYRYDFNLKDSQLFLTKALDDGKLALEDVYSCSLRHKAKAAFNGGFFYEGHAKNGIASNVLMTSRNIYAKNSDQPSIYKTKDNKIRFGQVEVDLFLSSKENPKIKIDSINNPVEKGIRIFTTNYWTSTLTNPDTYEMVVRRGSVHDGNFDGNNWIPTNGFVISTTNNQEKLFEKFYDFHDLKYQISIKSDGKEIDQKQIDWLISGSDFLVRNSKIPTKIYSKSNNSAFRDEPHGRTVICQLSEDNFSVIISDHNIAKSAYELSLKEIISSLKSSGLDRETALATSTGKILEMFNKTQKDTKYSVGMKLPEFAEYLKSMGCINAINMDGGGSSTLVVDNKIVNNPSGLQNKKIQGKTLREVGDIFIIKDTSS